MNISLENTDFLNSFDLLLETTIDKYQRERLSLYALKINANEFNYNNLQEQLVDPMIDYAVSREVKKQYSNRPGALSKKAREKFKEYSKNDGELGEQKLCHLVIEVFIFVVNPLVNNTAGNLVLIIVKGKHLTAVL